MHVSHAHAKVSYLHLLKEELKKGKFLKKQDKKIGSWLTALVFLPRQFHNFKKCALVFLRHFQSFKKFS